MLSCQVSLSIPVAQSCDSAAFDCADLRQHFNQRGLYYSLFDRIMSFQGKTQLKVLSPTYCVHNAQYSHLVPPVLLLHGTRDTCAPLSNAAQFEGALQRAGIEVRGWLIDQ